jgi:4-alpha-glucanotransferase
MYISRYALLRKAYARFKKNIPDDYEEFCKKESGWLDEYALFMAIKDANDGKSWMEWDDALRRRDEKLLEESRARYQDEIGFYKMLQYLFFEQWGELKAYANERGVYMIGDIPIYVAADSADVWANPTQFYLDKKLNPIEVAGCPPDAFTADGQLWGNPLFRWDVMKKDNYSWWIRRIKAMSQLYDIVRIDHFRGFDSYYAIPAKDKTARNGRWKKGPGMSLFRQIEKELGKLPIIAEDLGFLTPSVYKLLKSSGFPGMKVLQFAFDSREGSNYLPHTYPTNCVVYTGTHDNDTSLGWMETAPKASVQFAKEYLNLTEEEGLNWGMMRGAWSSVADMAIVPMQDLIGLGSEARINTPSTLGDNWKWRASSDQITPALAKRLYTYTEMYGRLSQTSLDEKAKKAAEKEAKKAKKAKK